MRRSQKCAMGDDFHQIVMSSMDDGCLHVESRLSINLNDNVASNVTNKF